MTKERIENRLLWDVFRSINLDKNCKYDTARTETEQSCRWASHRATGFPAENEMRRSSRKIVRGKI